MNGEALLADDEQRLGDLLAEHPDMTLAEIKEHVRESGSEVGQTVNVKT